MFFSPFPSHYRLAAPFPWSIWIPDMILLDHFMGLAFCPAPLFSIQGRGFFVGNAPAILHHCFLSAFARKSTIFPSPVVDSFASRERRSPLSNARPRWPFDGCSSPRFPPLPMGAQTDLWHFPPPGESSLFPKIFYPPCRKASQPTDSCASLCFHPHRYLRHLSSPPLNDE